MGIEQPAQLRGKLRTVGAGRDRARETGAGHTPDVEGSEMPPVGVVQEGATAGHPRPEVRPDRPENHDGAAGHVLTAVWSEALDHGPRPGVADAEPHPGSADDVEAAARRAVETGVARDRLAMRLGGEPRLGRDHDHAPGQAPGPAIVRLADEPPLDAPPVQTPQPTAGR